MADSYPAKYWWVILVGVPLGAGLIAILPALFGGGDGSGGGAEDTADNRISIEGSSVNGDVQIVGTQVIVEQLHKASLDEAQLVLIEQRLSEAANLARAGFYDDAVAALEVVASEHPTPAVYSDIAALRLVQNQQEEALAALKSGLALDPDYAPLRVNLARLYRQQGDVAAAKKQLQAVQGSPQGLAMLESMAASGESAAVEAEPNDSLLLPNGAQLSIKISATVADPGDRDFYLFTTADSPRDRLLVTVDNRSTSLRPRLTVWSSDKQVIEETTAANAGQNASIDISASPHTAYYASVQTYAAKGGAYQLSAVPQRKYDAFEPNDSLIEVAVLASPEAVAANLMDQHDKDFYLLPALAGEMSVKLHNESPSLRPRVSIWGPDKRQLLERTAANAGQNLSFSLKLESNERHFVSVVPYASGGGAYRLEFSGQ